jgi:hypothetical protein
MTRKDYLALSSALAVNKPNVTLNPQGYAVWLKTVHSVADVLAYDNGRFQRQRFLEACGVGRANDQ